MLNHPVNCGCKIQRQHLCRGVRPLPNECPGYEIKKSDGEAPVILKLWGMQVHLHCHYSQVHSDAEWYHLIGSYLSVK